MALVTTTAIPFDADKLEQWGYTGVWQTDGQTDKQMDRQTSCHGIVHKTGCIQILSNTYYLTTI